MNNREKKKYMNALLLSQSAPFVSQVSNRFDFLKNTPSKLYKYRPSFDDYGWDMLENAYAYLSPVTGLDDPFECLNDSGIGEYIDPYTSLPTKKCLSFVIDYFAKYSILTKKQVSIIKRCVYANVTPDGVEPEAIVKAASSCGIEPQLAELMRCFFEFFNLNIKSVLDGMGFDGTVRKALKPQDSVGICSLSEERDNKVMWSLYGKAYEGYCVEYEIPKDWNVISNLCPVFYTKKPNNCLAKKVMLYAFSSMIWTMTNGQLGGDDTAAYMELFCTKDSDWIFQKEWRILGHPKEHIKLPVKAVYIGFKASEEEEGRLIKIANVKGFSIFRMNKPDFTKKISYSLVFSPS